MNSTHRSMPAPSQNAENRHFFEATAEGRLLVKHCQDCGEYHHYPRALCPFCLSDRVEWTQASGNGTIYSFSVARRSGPHVYVIAYVTLDDIGVTLMSNIIDSDTQILRIGDPVGVAFVPAEDGTMLPVFRPRHGA